jgi:hypothetical protein
MRPAPQIEPTIKDEPLREDGSGEDGRFANLLDLSREFELIESIGGSCEAGRPAFGVREERLVLILYRRVAWPRR